MIVKHSRTFFNGLSDFADVLTDIGMPAIRRLASGINDTLASLILDFGVFIAPIPNLASITLILIASWGYHWSLAVIVALTIEAVLFLASDYAIKAVNDEVKPRWIFITSCFATYALLYIAIVSIEIVGHVTPNYTSLIWPGFSIIVNVIAASARLEKRKGNTESLHRENEVLQSEIVTLNSALRNEVEQRKATEAALRALQLGSVTGTVTRKTDTVTRKSKGVTMDTDKLLHLLSLHDTPDTINKTQLAEELGVTRQTLHRNIRKLEESGRLSMNGVITVK